MSNKLRWLRCAIAVAVCCHVLSFGLPVRAQSCTVTITAINYGANVDVLPGTPVDATGTMTATCTGAANRTVRICANLGRRNPTPATGNTSRRMQGTVTGTFINHELYADAARTQRWGSWAGAGYPPGGVQFDVPLNSSGSGSVARTIYARILASQQTARPDTYVSTLSGGTHSWSRVYVNTLNPALPTCPTGTTTNYAATSITATIPGLCYMTTTGVNFGSHTQLTSVVSATGAIAPQCSNTLPYTVSLGGGLSGATDPTQRKMSNGMLQVTYGLYRNNLHTLPWGSTVGVNTAAGTGTGFSQSIPVYGRLPVQAVPGTGTFSDSVVVTLTY